MRGCANCGSSSAGDGDTHVILSEAKDRLLRAVRSFAVFAAQDDGSTRPCFHHRDAEHTEAFVISVSLW